MNRIKRKGLAVFLVLAMIAALVPSVCLSAFAAAWNGSTTTPSMNADGYYLIDTGEKLAWFANRVNTGSKTIKAKQTANLDMGNRAFTPIGTVTYPFLGVYDGGGNTISNLKVEGALENRGLFGCLGTTKTVKTLYDDNGDPYTETTYKPGEVNNITLVNVNITGSKAVGGVVGNNEGGLVSGCSVTGRVSSTGSNVGGIVGHNRSQGLVLNCLNNATVSGTLRIGGIVGYAASGSAVKGCCNTGTISGDNYIGGIVGINSGSDATHSYNLGNVSATENSCGGLTGYCAYGKLFCMYTLGTVTCPGEYTGMAVGSSSYGAEIEKCYYDRDNTTMTDHYVTAAEHELMLDEIFLGSLNIDYDIFVGDYFHTNNGYPLLRWQLIAWDGSLGEPNTDSSGTYLITSGSELAWFSALVNGKLSGVARNTAAKAKVTKDILLNPAIFDETSNIWTPIGTQENPFVGTFDGGEYRISGIYVAPETALLDIGLFGAIGAGGTVKNIFVETSVINGYTNAYAHVGMIAGRNAGMITNCFNYGIVKGSYYAGGIVGLNEVGGTTQNCGNSGEVRGENYSGGIAGANSGRVTSCFNMDLVVGVQRTGGIIGTNYGVIQYCYNNGTIQGGTAVGGLVGLQNSTEANGFYACYNIGKVTGLSSTRGAVVGTFTNGDVKYCYYDSERSGASDTVATAKTTAEMATPTYLFSGFSSTYWIDRSADVYFDYCPELRVFYNSTNNLLKKTSKESAQVLKSTYVVAAEVDGEMNTYYASLNLASAHINKGEGVLSLLRDTTVTTTVPINGSITLQDNGVVHTISRAQTMKDALIRVTGELTLKGSAANRLVIDGAVTNRTDSASAVFVSASGTLVMQDGIKICGNVTDTKGGGVYVDGGTLLMQGGTITGNSAANGGGIYNYAGIVNATGGTISGNTATANGGGICFEGKFAEVTIDGLAITGNSAVSGGGIYNIDSPVQIVSGTITGNGATNGGGAYNKGTLSLSGGAFSGNTATASGKGIYENGKLEMSGLVSLATADDIYLTSGKTIINTAPIRTNGTVANITPATYLTGVRVLSGESCASNYAKFILNVPAGKNEMFINSTGYLVERETSNVAQVSMFGAYDVMYTSVKEAVEAIGTETGSITLIGNDIVEETIVVRGNITIVGNDKTPFSITRYRTCLGPMFKVEEGAVLSFGTIGMENQNGLQVDGGSLLYGTYGGSIVQNYGSFNLYDGATICNADVAGNGAGVLNEGDVTISGGVMTALKATNGGAVSSDGGTVTMVGGTVTGCTAQNGGAFHGTNGAEISLQGGLVTENEATNGGGAYIDGAVFTMPGGTIITTEQDAAGEAQYVEMAVVGTLSGNTAQNGGGVYIKTGSGSLTKGTISVNEATNGGGIYLSDGTTFEVGSGTLEGNTAKRFGAAIYDGGSLSLATAVHKNNDIYVLPGKSVEVKNASASACLTPGSYSIGSTMLTGSAVAASYKAFSVSNDRFFITAEGKLDSTALSVKESGTLTVDYTENFITGIDPEHSTVAELLAQFDNAPSSLTVMDPDGFSAESDAKVCTGYIIMLTDANGKTLDRKMFVLIGDVNGDGRFDGQDAVYARAIADGLLTKDQIGAELYRAADADSNGEVDIADADLLRACGMERRVVSQF